MDCCLSLRSSNMQIYYCEAISDFVFTFVLRVFQLKREDPRVAGYKTGRPKMRIAVARILRASKSLHNLSQISPRTKSSGYPNTFFGSGGVELSTLARGTIGAELSVLQVLRDEIRNLKLSRKEEVVPPEPFKLHDTPGCMNVILHRDFDHEKIDISCDLLLHPQDDADEAEEAEKNQAPYALLINLTITIKKDGLEALEISCQSHGDSYFINYVSYYQDSSKAGQDYIIHEKRIPEDLKREFLSFLFLRGVDDELAWYLHHHFERKKVEEKLLNFVKIADCIAQPSHAFHE